MKSIVYQKLVQCLCALGTIRSHYAGLALDNIATTVSLVGDRTRHFHARCAVLRQQYIYAKCYICMVENARSLLFVAKRAFLRRIAIEHFGLVITNMDSL